MLNALDLFSGYGGLSLALAPWVKPIAYCEIEQYPQSILLSRMEDGSLPRAPIWDDVRTLDGNPLRGLVDIIYGGFPCVDISLAGAGAGLEGERSGLFFQMLRLADEIQPTVLFFETVAAIRLRGLDRVVGELSARGYDCRWRMLSAEEIGAPHKRNRWWLLAAHAERINLWSQSGRSCGQGRAEAPESGIDGETQSVADATGARLETSRWKPAYDSFERPGWWVSEPPVGRVAHGCPHRVDRIKALGNGVVPLQARTAFRSLMFGDHIETLLQISKEKA